MNTQPLPPSPGKTEPGRRRTFALLVSSATAMLAGLAVGYALGTVHAYERQLAAEDSMEFEFATARNMRLGALVMARGEFCVEVLEPDECVAFVLLRGCLQITRQRAGEPASYCLHATPRAPLVIINPGTYTIVAERSAVGLRGVRRRT
jgi:hypothetical protein